MNEPIATYQSYLVRLWQDSPRAVWRASAQCVQTREIVHFADLDALFTFLWGQTTPHPSPPQREGAVGWTEEEPLPIRPQFPPQAEEAVGWTEEESSLARPQSPPPGEG